MTVTVNDLKINIVCCRNVLTSYHGSGTQEQLKAQAGFVSVRVRHSFFVFASPRARGSAIISYTKNEAQLPTYRLLIQLLEPLGDADVSVDYGVDDGLGAGNYSIDDFGDGFHDHVPEIEEFGLDRT